MPILNTENNIPVTETVTVPEERKIYIDEQLKTSTLFNEDNELSTIIRYVDGSEWVIDYFKQVRDINDTPKLPDVNLSAVQQQYHRINNLVLHLQSPLEQTAPDQLQGDAIINDGFLPSFGDVIYATLTGGREAIFTIDTIEKKIYNLHETYYVTFKLFKFLDVDSVAYNDILSKVAREYIYDKDSIQDKSAPILLNKDYYKKNDYKEAIPKITDIYLYKFISREKGYNCIPTIASTVIDTIVEDFIHKVMNVSSSIASNKITRLPYIPQCGGDNILNVIYNRDYNRYNYVSKNIDFVLVPSNTAHVLGRHISWFSVSCVTDTVDGNIPYIVSDIVENTLTKPADYREPLGSIKNNYIFSDDFYSENISGMGYFEVLILDYLKNKNIDRTQLDIALSQYPYWSTLEQFYLLPVLVLLLKEGMKNITVQL